VSEANDSARKLIHLHKQQTSGNLRALAPPLSGVAGEQAFTAVKA